MPSRTLLGLTAAALLGLIIGRVCAPATTIRPERRASILTFSSALLAAPIAVVRGKCAVATDVGIALTYGSAEDVTYDTL
jgi:hypothetical protein